MLVWYHLLCTTFGDWFKYLANQIENSIALRRVCNCAWLRRIYSVSHSLNRPGLHIIHPNPKCMCLKFYRIYGAPEPKQFLQHCFACFSNVGSGISHQRCKYYVGSTWEYSCGGRICVPATKLRFWKSLHHWDLIIIQQLPIFCKSTSGVLMATLGLPLWDETREQQQCVLGWFWYALYLICHGIQSTIR